MKQNSALLAILLILSVKLFVAEGQRSGLAIDYSKSMGRGNVFWEKDYVFHEPGFEIASRTVQFPDEYIVLRDNQRHVIPRLPEYTKKQPATFGKFSNSEYPLGYNRCLYLIEPAITLLI